jgi:hypothetical protein
VPPNDVGRMVKLILSRNKVRRMDLVLLSCFVSGQWNRKLQPCVVHNFKLASLLLT